jgi:hypothetical protein
MKKLYQNMCLAAGLIAVGSSMASDNPLYQDNPARVSIPAVVADGVPGQFQDIQLRFKTDDQLELVSVRDGVLLDYIQKVEAFRTNTSPVQVFLEITGQLPNGCARIGQVHQTRDNNAFAVSVFFKNDEWLTGAPVACTLAMVPFKHVMPLDVYDLPAGVYEYSVNDEFSGSFTLTTDNRLP